MAASTVIVTLLLLLLRPEAHTVESMSPKNFANLRSKKRFLSPRDLQGSYTRFLEVSENSTLCPNTITHTTNGVLYPNGRIHIPLRDISQDGNRCSGPGHLVLRFRRRMKSKEIEHEFNITADASGIDKMVRDILLALDGFYFGRQTLGRNCQRSHLPTNTAFLFTSQATPFAANVGVPFRRDPKIMFVVDKTRVCAFSGSFMIPERKAMEKQPVPRKSLSPKASATPLLNSMANTMESGDTKQATRHPSEKEYSTPQQQKRNAQSNQLSAQGPSIEDESTAGISSMLSEPNKKRQHTNKDMKASTPLPTSGSESGRSNKKHGTVPHRDKKEQRGVDNDKRSSPSPSRVPQKNSEGSVSYLDKHPHKSGRRPNRPSGSPVKKPSQTTLESNNPSVSPTTEVYIAPLPSASPKVLVQPSRSPPLRPHPNSMVSTADEFFPESSPSPSPLLLPAGEANHSLTHSHEDLQGSGPVKDPTIMPEPSEEVVIGDSSSTCFPASATVVLSKGRIKRMDELSVGTSVSVGNGKSSSIIDFSHFDRKIVSSFLHLQTDSGRNLTVTPSHFLYTDHGLVHAARVVLGDYLKLSDGRPTRVISISRVWSRGLFNPHTLTGTIVVDGFIVSTYTLAAAPVTAHALLAPVRFLYDYGFRTSIVSTLAKQPAIVRTFRSLLSSNSH